MAENTQTPQNPSVICKSSDSDPIRISYQCYEPEKCPVILMHGLIASKEVWSGLAQRIANKTHRKVYAYDARNHGESDYNDVTTIEQNVSDLFKFMETMKLEKAVLIGHSMGGQTACWAALQEPEKVEAIVSEDIYVRNVPAEVFAVIAQFVEKYVKCAESVPKEVQPSEAIAALFDIMSEKEPADSPFLQEKESLIKSNMLLKRKNDGSYEANFNKDIALQVLRDVDSLTREPKGIFTGPALFLYGKNSTFQVGNDKRHIISHFPNTQFVEVTNAGHHIHVDHADKFVEKVADFLNDFIPSSVNKMLN